MTPESLGHLMRAVDLYLFGMIAAIGCAVALTWALVIWAAAREARRNRRSLK